MPLRRRHGEDLRRRPFGTREPRHEGSRRDRGWRAAAADDRLPGIIPDETRARAARITRIDGVTTALSATPAISDISTRTATCFIVDRKKDLIKTSGYQVWPGARSRKPLPRIPLSAEVGGRRHFPMRPKGESREGLGGAARRTERSAKRTCAPSAASDWRRTRFRRRIEFRTDLPKTLIGKVLRRTLREGRGNPWGQRRQAARVGRIAVVVVTLMLLVPHLRRGTSIATRSMPSDSRRWPTFRSRASSPAPSRSRRMDIRDDDLGAEGRQTAASRSSTPAFPFAIATSRNSPSRTTSSHPTRSRRFGIKADDVTDLVLTHMQLGSRPAGSICFRRRGSGCRRTSTTTTRAEAWQSARTHGGIDGDDVLEIVKRNTEGKVSFVARRRRHVTVGHQLRRRRQSTHLRVAVRRRLDAFARGGDRVGQHVTSNENLDTHAAIAQDARCGVEPAHAGPDEVAGRRAAGC